MVPRPWASRAAGQQGRPHRRHGVGVSGVEGELDGRNGRRVGSQAVGPGDVADLLRQVDVALGHPLDLVLDPVRIAIDGVLADQLEIDEARVHPYLGRVPGGVGQLGDGSHEASCLRERRRQEARVQTLAQLAPVLEAGGDDVAVAEHVARLP